jgi:hypothetical protein
MLNATSHRPHRSAAVFLELSIAYWAIESIVKPGLDDDIGSIAAFLDETSGLVMV